MRRKGEASASAVLALLAGYNLVQNLAVPDRAYVPANLAVTGSLVALARRQGCTRADLGLRVRGAGWALAGVALVAGGLGAAAGHPASRRYFRDSRASGHSPAEQVYRALVRFPVGTALFEEVAFRGVVPALWRRAGTERSTGDLAGAVAFGLWHLLPTHRALAANPARHRLTSAGAVTAGAVVTATASLGLGWLRDRSGSLLAPWLTHAAFNTGGYLLARWAWRCSGG